MSAIVEMYDQVMMMDGSHTRGWCLMPYSDLSSNVLSGSIPNEWVPSPLQVLDLRDNRLDGVIPSSLGALTELTQVYVRMRSN